MCSIIPRLRQVYAAAFLLLCIQRLWFVLAAFGLLLSVQVVGAEPQTRLSLVAWEYETGPDLRECVGMLQDFSAQQPDLQIDMSHDDWSQAYDRISRWFGSQKRWSPSCRPSYPILSGG